MKTVLLIWLLLLPFQIYAEKVNVSLNENSGIQQSNSEINFIPVSEKASLKESDFQALVSSQENDIQKLKSELSLKNNEILIHDLDQWKFKSAALIFFLGTLLFAFLFIRSKTASEQEKDLTLNTIHTYK